MHVEMLQGPRVDVSGLWFRENQNHQNQKNNTKKTKRTKTKKKTFPAKSYSDSYWRMVFLLFFLFFWFWFFWFFWYWFFWFWWFWLLWCFGSTSIGKHVIV